MKDDVATLCASLGIDLEDWSQDTIDKIPSQVAYVYERLAGARQMVSKMETAHKRWAAQEKEMLLGQDPKKSEWKVKAHNEAQPKFAIQKSEIADAEALVTKFEGLTVALKDKVSIYQSRTALIREQLKNQ